MLTLSICSYQEYLFEFSESTNLSVIKLNDHFIKRNVFSKNIDNRFVQREFIKK
jgi:hypothetical protein